MAPNLVELSFKVERSTAIPTGRYDVRTVPAAPKAIGGLPHVAVHSSITSPADPSEGWRSRTHIFVVAVIGGEERPMNVRLQQKAGNNHLQSSYLPKLRKPALSANGYLAESIELPVEANVWMLIFAYPLLGLKIAYVCLSRQSTRMVKRRRWQFSRWLLPVLNSKIIYSPFVFIRTEQL